MYLQLHTISIWTCTYGGEWLLAKGGKSYFSTKPT